MAESPSCDKTTRASGKKDGFNETSPYGRFVEERCENTLIFRHDGPFEVHFQQKYRKSTAKTLAQKAFHAHFRP